MGGEELMMLREEIGADAASLGDDVIADGAETAAVAIGEDCMAGLVTPTLLVGDA